MICFVEYCKEAPKYAINIDTLNLSFNPDSVIYSMVRHFTTYRTTAKLIDDWIMKLPQTTRVVTGF